MTNPAVDDRSRLTPPPSGRLSPHEFARLFRDSFNVLWLIAVGVVGDRTLAEDVVQEAAIVALGKLDRFEPGTSFHAWMGQTVRYVALNNARKERKHRAVVQDLQQTDDRGAATNTGDEDPPSLRLTREARLPQDQAILDDRITSALDELSDVARSCLLLRVINNMPYSDIARVLDIPEGTAMSHVHRTRNYLRDRLCESDSADARSASNRGGGVA